VDVVGPVGYRRHQLTSWQVPRHAIIDLCVLWEGEVHSQSQSHIQSKGVSKAMGTP
jgi:hypothetical protein